MNQTLKISTKINSMEQSFSLYHFQTDVINYRGFFLEEQISFPWKSYEFKLQCSYRSFSIKKFEIEWLM